jgi:hypothetical protein
MGKAVSEMIPDEKCDDCPVYKACGWFGDILVQPKCFVDDRCNPDIRITDLSALRQVMKNPDLVLVAVEKRCGTCQHSYTYHDGISLTWGCKKHREYGGRKKKGPCDDWKWKVSE